MRHRTSEIDTLLEIGGGVIAQRDHPQLAGALDWLLRRGELCPVLPGVYTVRERHQDLGIRIRAAMLWDPDAVLTGASAARLSFWPKLPVSTVGLAVPRQHRSSTQGFQLVRRIIPPELVVVRGALRLTCPALTALDLCDAVGGDGIDTALRTRSASLHDLRAALALTSGRSGNAQRRQLLFDSRDEPWSAAERLGHRVLRGAGITGWKSNLPVPSLGQIYYLDVAWEDQLLALEIDGRLHETDLQLFESDRWRQNHLVLQGWRILRCTWRMLNEHPEHVVLAVRTALNLRTSRPLR